MNRKAGGEVTILLTYKNTVQYYAIYGKDVTFSLQMKMAFGAVTLSWNRTRGGKGLKPCLCAAFHPSDSQVAEAAVFLCLSLKV